MKHLFDTSDVETRVERLIFLISEYDQPFRVRQLRAFYNRKYPRQKIDANTTSTYVNYLMKNKKIQKLDRGLYATLEYKNKG